MSRYLTKSKFTHCLDCPTKLYYANNPGYKSKLEDDEFLQALAKGGVQVGELAKLYFPGGVDIPTLDTDEAIEETKKLLEQENVTIFEAAIRYDSCLVRVDIFKKNGSRINLIEVKSKSWDPEKSFVSSRSNTIKSDWQPYLFDTAFQTWVMQKAFPGYQIEPYLMLIDKTRSVTVEGLHQMFQVVEENGRYVVKVKEGISAGDLGEQILRPVYVGEEVNLILDGNGREPLSEAEVGGFDEWVEVLSRYLKDNAKYPVKIGKKCKDCEYRIGQDELTNGEKSGFEECWSEALGWKDKDFNKPHIFDLWYDLKTEEKLQAGVYHLEEMMPEMLPAPVEGLYSYNSWERPQRQTVQILKQTGQDGRDEVVLPGLFVEMDSCKFPLHFIDFEAVLPAIPFHKGRRPYEHIPFQFSCHTVYEDGSVEHRADWIEKRQGAFPGFDFVRELKKCLEMDEGTIFHYHHFEKTVLSKVADQLAEDNPGDADELIDWIRSLTGDGRMVDQQRLVVDHYYSPYMGGSNSIKAVLPAVLNESPKLKEIYSEPYSGFYLKEKTFYQKDEETGLAISPYQLLDPIHRHGLPDRDTDELILEDGEVIAEGGTAMMVWSRIQFDDIPEGEREAVIQSLLEYCELDTLAMVMIWQHWEWLRDRE